MAREKAMVYSHLLMVIDMKANLTKTKKKALEYFLTRTEISSKAHSLTTRNKRACLNLPTETNTKANLRTKILMAKVVSHIKMVGYMLVNGRIT